MIERERIAEFFKGEVIGDSVYSLLARVPVGQDFSDHVVLQMERYITERVGLFGKNDKKGGKILEVSIWDAIDRFTDIPLDRVEKHVQLIEGIPSDADFLIRPSPQVKIVIGAKSSFRERAGQFVLTAMALQYRPGRHETYLFHAVEHHHTLGAEANMAYCDKKRDKYPVLTDIVSMYDRDKIEKLMRRIERSLENGETS